MLCLQDVNQTTGDTRRRSLKGVVKMRLIKMFGLAAIVITAFMATVQVGTAAAVTLLEEVVWCSVRVPHKCDPANYFHSGTEVFAAGTKTEFLSNLGNVKCAASELLMTNAGLLVHGDVTALAFGECSHEGGAKCTVTAENLNYLFTGKLKSDHVAYEIAVKEKPSNGVPKITVECGMVIHCTYTAKEVSIDARLAFTPEILKVLQEFIAFQGFFCAKNMTWHDEYTVKCRQNEVAELKNCWVKMENWSL